MKTEYKYLVFEVYDTTGKTYKYKVWNKNNVLGVVKWFAPFRKYCFYPHFQTVFDASCLADIQDFLNQLMQERKGEKEG